MPQWSRNSWEGEGPTVKIIRSDAFIDAVMKDNDHWDIPKVGGEGGGGRGEGAF